MQYLFTQTINPTLLDTTLWHPITQAILSEVSQQMMLLLGQLVVGYFNINIFK